MAVACTEYFDVYFQMHTVAPGFLIFVYEMLCHWLHQVQIW